MRLLVLDALAHDRQVGLEIQLEHAQRVLDVGGRRRDRDQRRVITSHLRTWYSIHSLLIVMSPSKKWNRGFSSHSLTRSVLMSIP